jgi:hypothetical protein
MPINRPVIKKKRLKRVFREVTAVIWRLRKFRNRRRNVSQADKEFEQSQRPTKWLLIFQTFRDPPSQQ